MDLSPFLSKVVYDGPLEYLEHVVVRMSLGVSEYEQVGDITIDLESPNGTMSTLLQPVDHWLYFTKGYSDWPFMSAMFWGENPTGQWNLTVRSTNSSTIVDVSKVEFEFYGVSHVPEAVANIPDQCHSDCRRGCAREGTNFCDSCVNLRNAYTLECINDCPPGYTQRNGYCYDSSLPVEECNSPLKIKDEGIYENMLRYFKRIFSNTQFCVLMLDIPPAALRRTVK